MEQNDRSELISRSDHSWWVWPLVGVLSFFMLAYQNCASYEVAPPIEQKVSQ